MREAFSASSAINMTSCWMAARGENASELSQIRKLLCEEFGLSGRRIAADLLHISLHGIGAYDGCRAPWFNARSKLEPRFWRSRRYRPGSCDGFGPSAKCGHSYYAPATKRAGYFPSVTWQGDEKCRISPNSIAVHAAHDSAVRRSHVAERSIDAIQWSYAILS